ncbi:MAG: hypothetical protein KJO69_04065 [Gammaproteobacteria bacterium]|nr:hypothetical protein [Gammaproteobacteria bacterium]
MSIQNCLETACDNVQAFSDSASSSASSASSSASSASQSATDAAASAALATASANYEGQWVSGTSYAVGDSVMDDGLFYICNTATSGTTAPASDTAWDYIPYNPKMSVGNINSPLLDLPLKNSLAMKQGVGSVTFTRTTTGTYIDRYGVLQTAAIDEPRFEKEGLLIEGDSTNLLTYSNDFSQADWTTLSTNISKVTGKTSPDGTANATEVTATATDALLRHNNTVITNGSDHTISVWVRRVTGTGDISIINTELVATVINVTSEWKRFEVSATAGDTTGTCYLRIATSGDVLEVFGWQLEELPFASSYIPTTTTEVTRSADVLYADNIDNVPNVNLANPNMSVSIDYDSFGNMTSLSQILVGQYQASTNYWYLRKYSTDTRIGVTAKADGVISYSEVTGETDKTNVNRRATATFGNENVSIYEDGVLALSESTLASPFANPSSTTKLYIGSLIGSSNYLYGHVSNLRIWDTELSQQEATLA